MGKRIVFVVDGDSVGIIIPVDGFAPIEKVGLKDVPDGAPFWIVEESAFPADRTFRDAWEFDVAAMGPPSGVGNTSEFDNWRNSSLQGDEK